MRAKPGVKVAIGASFTRRQEIKDFADDLAAAGVEVTSDWFNQEADEKNTNKLNIEHAIGDLRAIREADYFVRFANDFRAMRITAVTIPWATGGHDFETGYAFALGKPIFVVGGRQSIFDRLPNLIHVKDEVELLRMLSPVEVM